MKYRYTCISFQFPNLVNHFVDFFYKVDSELMFLWNLTTFCEPKHKDIKTEIIGYTKEKPLWGKSFELLWNPTNNTIYLLLLLMGCFSLKNIKSARKRKLPWIIPYNDLWFYGDIQHDCHGHMLISC